MYFPDGLCRYWSFKIGENLSWCGGERRHPFIYDDKSPFEVYSAARRYHAAPVADQIFTSQTDSSFAARHDVAIARDAAGLRRTAAAWIETYRLS